MTPTYASLPELLRDAAIEIERLRGLIGYRHIGYWCDFGHSQVVKLRDERQIMGEQEAEIERLRGLISQMVDAYDLRMDGAISADDYLAVLDLLREEARRANPS